MILSSAFFFFSLFFSFLSLSFLPPFPFFLQPFDNLHLRPFKGLNPENVPHHCGQKVS